jgi:hypothetical protein
MPACSGCRTTIWQGLQCTFIDDAADPTMRWLTSSHVKLQRSFFSLWCLLAIPRISRRVVIGLLVIHTSLLAYSAYVHSPTLNEPAHLVAGLSNWRFGRFDLFNMESVHIFYS